MGGPREGLLKKMSNISPERECQLAIVRHGCPVMSERRGSMDRIGGEGLEGLSGREAWCPSDGDSGHRTSTIWSSFVILTTPGDPPPTV